MVFAGNYDVWYGDFPSLQNKKRKISIEEKQEAHVSCRTPKHPKAPVIQTVLLFFLHKKKKRSR